MIDNRGEDQMRDTMLCWQTGFSSLFFFASLCLTISRVWSGLPSPLASGMCWQQRWTHGMHEVIMTFPQGNLVSPLHHIRPTFLTDEPHNLFPPLHLTHREHAARLVRDAVKLRASRAPRAIAPPIPPE